MEAQAEGTEVRYTEMSDAAIIKESRSDIGKGYSRRGDRNDEHIDNYPDEFTSSMKDSSGKGGNRSRSRMFNEVNKGDGVNYVDGKYYLWFTYKNWEYCIWVPG